MVGTQVEGRAKFCCRTPTTTIANYQQWARPMAPARSSTRHPHIDQISIQQPDAHQQDIDPNVNSELFIDPMLGTPLAMYIEKDVEDRETVAGVITVGRVLISCLEHDCSKSIIPWFKVGRYGHLYSTMLAVEHGAITRIALEYMLTP